MRVLITGGRDFYDEKAVYRALSGLERRAAVQPLLIIHGACPTGVDDLVDTWARWSGYEQLRYPVTRADWRHLGRRAGPLRNQRMIDEGKPDGAVAFPGGSGTADMVRRLRAAGVPTWIPYAR